MTDSTTPDDSGTEKTPDRSLADWMRITQRAFMRRVAEEVGSEGIDMRAAMAAKFHGHPSPESDKLAAAVKAVQDAATASLPADDLAATLRTLEAIARELGWSEEQQQAGPWRGFARGPWAGFGPGRGFGRGWTGAPGFEHGHGYEHAHAFGHHADCHGGHGRGHGRHPKRERAYERGFEAGFEAAHRHHPAPPAPHAAA